jgi:hypothetical protein
LQLLQEEAFVMLSAWNAKVIMSVFDEAFVYDMQQVVNDIKTELNDWT